MTQQGNETSTANNIWLRGVFMILFGILYSLAGTVLLVVAVLQFILVLTGSAPNTRLLNFGSSLGSYVQQIVHFQPSIPRKSLSLSPIGRRNVGLYCKP